ncbi:MAG TPA: MMPL family transporter [Myxococcota bacterium]|nr:MMPL family transporter [Myxococcota bacterium]
MERLGGLYAALAVFAYRRTRLVTVVTLLITLLATVIGLPPKVDSNLLNLLPDSDPTVQSIKRINDEEGGANMLTLSFRGDDPQKLDAYLDQLAEDLSHLEEVQFALHDIDPQLALHIGLLQLEPGDIRTLSSRLQGALALGSAASNPFIAQRLMDMGPLTERIEKASSGGLVSAGKGHGKVLVRPTGPAVDPRFARRLMTDVQRVIDASDPAGHGVEIAWIGGAYRHTVEDVDGITADLVWTNVFSLAALIGILVFSFRSLRSLAILLPPLFVANTIALAFADLAFGSINTYTSLGTAILFGLGIDYSVHLVGRFRENRVAGSSMEQALADSWEMTGPPCTTAAVTSAAGFVALTVAEFKGFAQLGLLLAVGLMLCLVANLVLLPPLLGWLEKEPLKLRGVAVERDGSHVPRYRWAPPLVLVTSLLTIVLGLWAIPGIEFEYDLSQMRRDGLAYDELTDEQRELVRQSYAPVIVSYGPGDDVRGDQAHVDAEIAAGHLPHVSFAVSLAKALPPDQAQRNEAIAELVKLVEDENLRYLPPVLARRLLPLRGLQVHEIHREDLPAPVLQLLGANHEGVDRMLIFPKGNMWDVREAQALSEEIHGVLPGREIAGEQLGVATMFLYALRDTPRMVMLVLVLVVVFTWLDLQRVTWTLGALGSLVAGIVWAVAALHGMGTKLSMVNLTGVPMLLGMGVDVVVHLSHRMRDEGPGGLTHALRTTGVAAAISTSANAASFGSLIMAGNRGVRSLGLLVGVGLAVLTIISVGLLTALWAWGWRFRPDAPRAGD